MSLTAEERDHLRATARNLLERESAPQSVRKVVAELPGHDPTLWNHLVKLGWTAIHLPEEHGGAGCTYTDLAVVLGEMGRAIAPVPFLSSAVLATGALLRAENSGLASTMLPSLATGQCVGSVAVAAVTGSHDESQISTIWESAGGMLRLSGAAGCVLDADLADFVIVAAIDSGRAVAVIAVDAEAPGLSLEHRPTTDPTRRLFTVTFEDVTIEPDRLLCEPGDAGAALREQVLALGTIAAMADATGVAGKVLDVTTSYAKERTQFGRPIGSFQAVKHHCANMAIAVEASRAAIRAAADALDGDPSQWSSIASMTASHVGPACSETTALGLRVHGGIGFTWEHDAHLYLKRAKLDEVLFGTPAWHRRRLANAVLPNLDSTT